MTDHSSAAPDEGPEAEPSVRKRIERSAGVRARISLRDVAQLGETPLIKPLDKTAPEIPERAGKYRVQGEIARGGVGVVLKAVDTDLGRDVAVKFLLEKHRGDPELIERFVEEAQISGQLQHPGVIPVYDLGLDGDTPYFSMKLIKGRTLAALLADRESPQHDRRRLVATFLQVCQTMAYAHARGVVHRDLKPANIMIGAFGEVLVVDWGMGKVLRQGGVADERKGAGARRSETTIIQTVRTDGEGSASQVGSIFGTPRYMPPEQAMGDVDAMDERSDVFALGAILTEILSGEPPYTGSMSEILHMIVRVELGPARERLEVSGAEPELIAIALDCMTAAPGERPRHAGIVADRIGQWLAKADDQLQEARVRVVAARRTRNIAALGVLLVLCALGVAVMFFDREKDQRRLAETATEEARDAERKEHAMAQAARDARAEAEAALETTRTAQLEERRQREVAVEKGRLAELERTRFDRITRFLSDMFALADPQISGVRSTPILKLLDEAAKRIGTELADDAPAQAHLRTKIGSAYLAIGEMEKAGVQLRQAVDLIDRAETPDVALLYEAVRGVVQLARWGFDEQRGHWDRRYASLLPDVLEADHPQLAATLRLLLDPAPPDGDAGEDETGSFGDPAHWIDRVAEALPKGDPQRLVVRDALIEIPAQLAVLAPADPGGSVPQHDRLTLACWEHAFRICEEELSAGHPEIVAFAGGFADVLRKHAKDPGRAEQVTQRVLGDAARGVSDRHWRVADLENSYGLWLSSQDERERDAVMVLERSHAALVEHYGGETSRTAGALGRLGRLHLELGSTARTTEIREALLVYAREARAGATVWLSLGPLLPERLRPLEEARSALDGLLALPPAERGERVPDDFVRALIDKRKELMPDPGADPYAVPLARWMAYATYYYRDVLGRHALRALGSDALRVLRPWRDRAPLALAYAWYRRYHVGDSASLRLSAARSAYQLYAAHLEEPGEHTHYETLLCKARMAHAHMGLGQDEQALALLPDAAEKLLGIIGENAGGSGTYYREKLIELYLRLGAYDEAGPLIARQISSPRYVSGETTLTYVAQRWPDVAKGFEALSGALARKDGIRAAWADLAAARAAAIGEGRAGRLCFVNALAYVLGGRDGIAAPGDDTLPCYLGLYAEARRLFPPRHAMLARAAAQAKHCYFRVAALRAAEMRLDAGRFGAAEQAYLAADRHCVATTGPVRAYGDVKVILEFYVAAGRPAKANAWALPILESGEGGRYFPLWALVYVRGLDRQLYRRGTQALQDRYGVAGWTWSPAYQAAWMYYWMGDDRNGIDSLDRDVEWPPNYEATRLGLQALCYQRRGEAEKAAERLAACRAHVKEGRATLVPLLAQELDAIFGDR